MSTNMSRNHVDARLCGRHPRATSEHIHTAAASLHTRLRLRRMMKWQHGALASSGCKNRDATREGRYNPGYGGSVLFVWRFPIRHRKRAFRRVVDASMLAVVLLSLFTAAWCDTINITDWSLVPNTPTTISSLPTGCSCIDGDSRFDRHMSCIQTTPSDLCHCLLRLCHAFPFRRLLTIDVTMLCVFRVYYGVKWCGGCAMACESVVSVATAASLHPLLAVFS